MLHGVEQGKAGDYGAARGVYVEVDWFGGVLRIQVEEDADYLVSYFVVDLTQGKSKGVSVSESVRITKNSLLKSDSSLVASILIAPPLLPKAGQYNPIHPLTQHGLRPKFSPPARGR